MGTDDEEAADVAIAVLANATKAILAATRVLSWHQSEPGGELPT